MKELIFTDSKFISETEAEIQKSLSAQQNLLNVWNGLNLGVCPDLFALAHDPYNVFRKAAKIPEKAGSYRIGEAFLEIDGVPMPNELYVAAREAKRCILTGRRDLWRIEDNKSVVVNQDVADILIHSHDIFAENEKQKNFIKACIALVQSNNELIPVLQNMLTMRSGFSMPVKVTAAGYSFLQQLELDVEAVREMIKNLN